MLLKCCIGPFKKQDNNSMQATMQNKNHLHFAHETIRNTHTLAHTNVHVS